MKTPYLNRRPYPKPNDLEHLALFHHYYPQVDVGDITYAYYCELLNQIGNVAKYDRGEQMAGQEWVEKQLTKKVDADDYDL